MIMPIQIIDIDVGSDVDEVVDRLHWEYFPFPDDGKEEIDTHPDAVLDFPY